MAQEQSTNVILTDIGTNAEKILKTLLKGINDIDDRIREGNNADEDNDRRTREERRKDAVKSEISQRRQAAAQAAVHGEIRKGSTLLVGIKNVLGTIKNYLADVSKRTIKSFDSLAQAQRKLLMSTDDIVNNQLAATKQQSILKDKNIRINRDDIGKITTALAEETGTRFSQLSEAQQSVITVAMAKNKLSAQEALNLAMTVNEKNQDDILKTLIKGTDLTGQAVFKKTLQAQSEAWFKAYANQKGGTEVALKQMQESGQKLDALLGAQGTTAEDQFELLETLAKLQTGQLERAKETSIKQILAIAGGDNEVLRDPSKLADVIERGIREQKFSDENLRVLGEALGGENSSIAKGLATLNASYKQTGEIFKKSIEEDDKKRFDAVNVANEGGIFGNFIDTAITSFDEFTGGWFSKAATAINEWFGEDLSLEQIVTKGFSDVKEWLIAIATSNLFSGAFSGGVTGALTKLKGIGSKFLTAAGGILKKFVTFLFNPATLAAVGAITTISIGVSEISKAVNRKKNVDETENKFKAAAKKIDEIALDLRLAETTGNQELAEKYKQQLKEASADLKEASKNYKDALDKSTAIRENVTDYSKRKQQENKEYQAEIDELRKKQQLAKQYNNFDLEEDFKNQADSLQAKINENNKKMANVKKYAEDWYTNALSSILGVFGKKLSDKELENYGQNWSAIYNDINKIKKGVSEKFNNISKDASEGLNALKVGARESWNTIKTGAGEALDGIKTSVSEKWENFKTDIGKGLDDFKNKAKEKWETFIKPIKDFFKFDWLQELPEPIKKILGISDNTENKASYSESGIGYLANAALTKGERLIEDSTKMIEKGVAFVKGLWPFAEGGIVNKPTPALVGEDGKEVVLPLTKPGIIGKILSNLSSNEKRSLLSALLGFKHLSSETIFSNIIGLLKNNKSTSTAQPRQNVLSSLPTNAVPGDDPATIQKILAMAGPYSDLVYNNLLHGYKGNYKDGFKQRKKWYDEALVNAANQEGRDMIRGTYAERALDYGVSELGKPYILRALGKIGYVCNELVNACIQASGFDMGKFRINGVGATFRNINSGKMSGKGYPNFRIRNDLTPQTAMPGMLFFQDSRKNKDGGFQPGHIGLVYYGHQKLHASGGASSYKTSTFLRDWQTPCRGVTVTPFDNKSYVIGELPGLFEKANGEFSLPKNAQSIFGPVDISKDTTNVNKAINNAGLLSNEEINAILNEAGKTNSATMQQYITQAKDLMNSSNKNDVIAILTEIARYIKGIAIATKPKAVAVGKPPASVFGI